MLNQKLEHFRNLVSLAAADGKIEHMERVTLSKIAYDRGIPMDRMNVMLSHANEYQYLIPQNHEEKDDQLEDMINFALVDGDFANAEKELIMLVGERLGYSKSEINKKIAASLNIS